MHSVLPPENSGERAREPSEFPSMRQEEFDAGVVFLFRSPAVQMELNELQAVEQSKRALASVRIEPVHEPAEAAPNPLVAEALLDEDSIRASIDAIHGDEHDYQKAA